MNLPQYKSKKNILELTPLIDVMFLLLIFFMLTMPEEAVSDIPVNLPSASGKSEIENNKTISITITSSNKIIFKNEVVDIEALQKKLEGIDKIKSKILIRGDAGSELGATVKIWQLAKKVGFKKIGIAVQK
ncbi:MAG: hypothetical protein COA79_06645 [Planctomycetota bacterium]|nr:MAG: hypothetical protein COA79_06645 [Planctomycetota bacterium]